jgi:hypothetical protein
MRPFATEYDKNTTKYLSGPMTISLKMEKMGDLLEMLRRFDSLGSTKEAATEVFGWGVEEVTIREERPGVDQVIIQFFNDLIIEARHILTQEGVVEFGEEWDFRMKIKTNLTSTIRYNVFYSRYIHGKGYLRNDIGYVENRLLRKMLEDFYIPRQRSIYKPIILEFKGLHDYDFFGIEVDRNHSEIYYSTVRQGREEAESDIDDVIGRLNYLSDMMKDEKLRKALKALDEDLCKVLCILCPSG